ITDITPFFSPFEVPSTSRSISSPERARRRANIIEAIQARTIQLEQRDEKEEVERDGEEIKMPFKKFPSVSPKRQPMDEFESDEEGEGEKRTVHPVKPVKKTPTKGRKPSKTTVSPTEKGSRAKMRPSSRGKTTPLKVYGRTATGAKAAAAAARKKEQARNAKLLRLKRELARRLEKSSDRWNSAARTMVDEEDRNWRTNREVTPLERKDWSGEERLFSWQEIHNARRKMAIDVEPKKEGELRVESLHSVSSSAYLARSVDLKKRSEVDGLSRVVKSFDCARSPPLDWSYEEKETEEVLHPTVSSLFVPGGELRCL
ncbi:hypothetical protein PENTCL1PPCAC_7492, partial [Pristionchus entomophagus]